MATVRHCKKQICNSLLILILTIGFKLEVTFGHQCQHSGASTAHESHIHHQHSDHSHDHQHMTPRHHADDDDHVLGVKKLPEELAEEEDLRLLGFGSLHDHGLHHYHDGGSELSGAGLWIHALGCSLLVSLASLICLILLPLIFIQGKPSKALVDSLAIFGAGAMLGDAFLHQLPHAFGGEHSHSHNHQMGAAHQDIDSGHSHSHSHSHSIKDLSVGLSILIGIVLFLLVEKVVRYVEDMSGGVDSWSHGHHHHHRKNLKDVNGTNNNTQRKSLNEKDGSTTKIPSDDIKSEKASDRSRKAENKSEYSVPRKRYNTGTRAVGNEVDPGAENGPNVDIKSMTEKEPIPYSSTLVFGYLNLFSDGVHNFTDGMALGSAFLLYGSVGGWSRTLFLLAHELPQEIGDFGILVRSGFSVSKALFFNFLSALVALAGTALALSLGEDAGQSCIIEGFTAGGFIYIAVAGVLGEMKNGSSSLKRSAIQLTSLVVGMSVALFISLVE